VIDDQPRQRAAERVFWPLFALLFGALVVADLLTVGTARPLLVTLLIAGAVTIWLIAGRAGRRA
jgi:uncharacterized membrane protein